MSKYRNIEKKQDQKGLFTFYFQQQLYQQQKINPKNQHHSKSLSQNKQPNILPLECIKDFHNKSTTTKPKISQNIIDKFLQKCYNKKKKKQNQLLIRLSQNQTQKIQRKSKDQSFIKKQKLERQQTLNSLKNQNTAKNFNKNERKKNKAQKKQNIILHIKTVVCESNSLKTNQLKKQIPQINLSKQKKIIQQKLNKCQNLNKNQKQLPLINNCLKFPVRKNINRQKQNKYSILNKQYIDYQRLKSIMIEGKQMERVISHVNMNNDLESKVINGWPQRKKEFLKSIENKK